MLHYSRPNTKLICDGSKKWRHYSPIFLCPFKTIDISLWHRLAQCDCTFSLTTVSKTSAWIKGISETHNTQWYTHNDTHTNTQTACLHTVTCTQTYTFSDTQIHIGDWYRQPHTDRHEHRNGHTHLAVLLFPGTLESGWFSSCLAWGLFCHGTSLWLLQRSGIPVLLFSSVFHPTTT